MKIFHFSDTHLGFNDLDVLTSENINQREADFYHAFEQVADQIKVLKPDYVIHTGDLFHRSSPSNRAITFALRQFKQINALNIPFILIAGNHSTPRTNLSSPILKIFETFDNIHLSYEQEYKKFEFEDIIFHCLPHMNDEKTAEAQITMCEQNIHLQKKNVMMMHCSVGSHYLMQEFGEWVYPKDKEYLFEQMDYVALGHWHGFGNVGKYKNVYYAGSTERTGLNDKRNSKGFIIADLSEELYVRYYAINIRQIISLEIDCEDYTHSVNNLNLGDLNGAIVDVKLTNLTSLQSMDISNNDIKELFRNAMYVNVRREFKVISGGARIEDIQSMSLEDFFVEHIKVSAAEDEFDRLKQKVQSLFSQYEEAYSDTE